MYTQELPDSAGTFNSPTPYPGELCKHCKTETMVREVWESSDGAYEDEKFSCTTCKHGYWIDGIDS